MAESNKTQVLYGQFWQENNTRSRDIFRITKAENGIVEGHIPLGKEGFHMPLNSFLKDYDPARFVDVVNKKIGLSCNYYACNTCCLGSVNKEGEWHICKKRNTSDPRDYALCPHGLSNKGQVVQTASASAQELLERRVEQIKDLQKKVAKLEETIKYRKLHSDILERALENQVPNAYERNKALERAEHEQAEASGNGKPITLEYDENNPFPGVAKVQEQLEKEKRRSERYKRKYLFEKLLRERNGKKKTRKKEVKAQTVKIKSDDKEMVYYSMLPPALKEVVSVFGNDFWTRHSDGRLILVTHYYVEKDVYHLRGMGQMGGTTRGDARVYNFISNQWLPGDWVKKKSGSPPNLIRIGSSNADWHPRKYFKEYYPALPEEVLALDSDYLDQFEEE